MAETMAERLKRLRVAKGLKADEFAKRLGIPVTTYRDWEKGRAIQGQPYIDLAKALGVTLSTVMGVPEIVAVSLRKEWLLKEIEELLTMTP